MSEKERIFLTREEALSAVLNDLRQYRPQKRLFMNLCADVFGRDTLVVDDLRREGLWISAARSRSMRYVGILDLRERLCREIEQARPSSASLANLCGRVFDTAAFSGGKTGNGTRKSGIWLETGMETFACRQCGRCCRKLDYHRELTLEDYGLWKRLGRTDILERVKVYRRNGRITAFGIWSEPGTDRFSEVCPWLRELPKKDRWICGIHEVKPEVCRQYPGSRKHGRMTGCLGFGD
jgi:Fe-S-cluster containining protein